MKLHFHFQRCLVLVPHPDDETNIAGGLISSMHESGVETFIAYSTNGDWRYTADLRVREARRAAWFMGKIPEDHLFFLGYGDTYFDPNHNHIFYHREGNVLSKSGHRETYGGIEWSDFAYFRRGEHSAYNRASFCRDLRDLILFLKTDLIICSDYDEHPDHRMLTLCFDEVMCEILKSNPDYKPSIMKAFAYCTAYSAVADFYINPLPETQMPQIGVTEKYNYDMVGASLYEWDNRMRIPVPEAFLNKHYCMNPKAKALAIHLSQPIISHADRIINRDEVFWRRRTDSLSYTAKVSASSGDAYYLNDFRLYNTNDIDSLIPQFCHYLWEPDESDSTREFCFEWETPQTISQVHLYGDLNAKKTEGRITIRLDNGFTDCLDALPARGTCLRFKFAPQTAKRCTVRVAPEMKIAECEIYAGNEEALFDLEETPKAKQGKYEPILGNKLFVFWLKVKRKLLKMWARWEAIYRLSYH